MPNESIVLYCDFDCCCACVEQVACSGLPAGRYGRHADVVCNQARVLVGTACALTCTDGHVRRGPAVVRCRPDGRWDGAAHCDGTPTVRCRDGTTSFFYFFLFFPVFSYFSPVFPIFPTFSNFCPIFSNFSLFFPISSYFFLFSHYFPTIFPMFPVSPHVSYFCLFCPFPILSHFIPIFLCIFSPFFPSPFFLIKCFSCLFSNSNRLLFLTKIVLYSPGASFTKPLRLTKAGLSD